MLLRILLGVAVVSLCTSPGLTQIETVAVSGIASELGVTSATNAEGIIELSGGTTRLHLAGGSRRMLCDGLVTWLNAPPVTTDAGPMLASADACSTVVPLLALDSVVPHRTVTTVVIDPGHGGSDSGARSAANQEEKDVVLDICKRVRRILQASGIRTLLTRDGDQTRHLAERTLRAQEWDADLFISIHANSAPNALARGIETYVLPAPGFASTSGSSNRVDAVDGNDHDSANMVLAFFVHKGMLAHTGQIDRGIRRARFEVLSSAPCPAVLLECGFLSNRDGAERLGDTDYREALSEGIARGVLTYVSRSDPL